MSIILDTSVWIEYLKGNPEYFDICQGLIEAQEIRTIEIIFAELLQGALNKREMKLIRDYYEAIPKIELDQLLIKGGEYSREHNLISKGIGLIDAIIMSATITASARLWTLDKKLKAYLPVEYVYGGETNS